MGGYLAREGEDKNEEVTFVHISTWFTNFSVAAKRGSGWIGLFFLFVGSMEYVCTVERIQFIPGGRPQHHKHMLAFLRVVANMRRWFTRRGKKGGNGRGGIADSGWLFSWSCASSASLFIAAAAGTSCELASIDRLRFLFKLTRFFLEPTGTESLCYFVMI